MRTTDAMREVLARPIAKVPALRGRQRHDPVLRGLDPDAGLVRGRGQEPVGRRRQHRRRDVVGLEGRVARRHGADGRGARRPHAGHPPRGLRRAVPRGRDRSAGPCSTAATAGTPTRPRRCSTCTRCASGCPAARWPGRKVVILGDVLHSRVARSNIWTLTAAGADLWLCGPPTLLRGFEAWAGRGARGRPAVPRHDLGRRGAARRRRRHGAADPARADGVAGCCRRCASTRRATG